MSKLYTDKDWLHQKYIVENLSKSEMGRLVGVSDVIIGVYLKRFEIERSEEPYKNRDWLYDQYINEKKSSLKIAEELGVSKRTILVNLKKFNSKEVHRGYFSGQKSVRLS